MNGLSVVRQRVALGEGLALGAHLLGIEQVGGNKTTLELSFRKAWRGWAYADKLPAINAGPSRDDLVHVLSKSSRRTTHHVAEWHGAWPFVPVILFDWTISALAEAIHDEIPASAWRDLVAAWLSLPSSNES